MGNDSYSQGIHFDGPFYTTFFLLLLAPLTEAISKQILGLHCTNQNKIPNCAFSKMSSSQQIQNFMVGQRATHSAGMNKKQNSFKPNQCGARKNTLTANPQQNKYPIIFILNPLKNHRLHATLT